MPTSVKEVAKSAPLRVAAAAFGIAAIGVVLAIGASQLGASMWIAQAGFGIVVLGVVMGFAAIAWGQLRYGKEATQGSWKSMHELRRSVFDFFRTRR